MKKTLLILATAITLSSCTNGDRYTPIANWAIIDQKTGEVWILDNHNEKSLSVFNLKEETYEIKEFKEQKSTQ
jgi:hypothetical protein